MRSHGQRAEARCAALLALLVLLAVPASAQDLRETLFRGADAALSGAREVQADVLAPKSFGEGMKLYEKAEEDLRRGRNIDDIRRNLQEAVGHFERATEATKLANVTFTKTIEARDDAKSADAAQFATAEWQTAEEKFAEAARKLEEGNVNAATKRGTDAEEAYRAAELSAIKVNFLDETRTLLAQADREKVDKYAPKTLERARTLLSQAEEALDRDRYDTDTPRSLARDAKYEAKHALYIAGVARDLDKKKMSLEDLLLASEKPLVRIAGLVDVTAEFDRGWDPPTAAIVEGIEKADHQRDELSADLADSRQHAAALDVQVAELEKRLGGVSEETLAMKARMEAEARVREKFVEVEKTFTSDEARVLREGNDLIVRLVGLNFDVGKSVIQPAYFGLLTKVQNAIRVFPDSRVRVEGHTDSHGTDETNLTLSNERAEAVRQYLIANMGLAPDRVEALGFGETQPIANNETAEGRARNRRIDIVIEPNLEAVGR